MANLEKIREYISYDSKTGAFVRLKNKARAKAGDSVGWIDEKGYRRAKFDGETLFLHVLAWELFHGQVPDGYDVDHIDRDPGNNVLSNLRLATRSQNMHNTRIRKSNKTGVKGVNWNKHAEKYQGQIMLNRKKIHVGYFDSLEDAEVAVRKRREALHGNFSRHA